MGISRRELVLILIDCLSNSDILRPSCSFDFDDALAMTAIQQSYENRLRSSARASGIMSAETYLNIYDHAIRQARMFAFAPGSPEEVEFTNMFIWQSLKGI